MQICAENQHVWKETFGAAPREEPREVSTSRVRDWFGRPGWPWCVRTATGSNHLRSCSKAHLRCALNDQAPSPNTQRNYKLQLSRIRRLIPNCIQTYKNGSRKGGGPPSALVVRLPMQAGRGRPASCGHSVIVICLNANWYHATASLGENPFSAFREEVPPADGPKRSPPGPGRAWGERGPER